MPLNTCPCKEYIAASLFIQKIILQIEVGARFQNYDDFQAWLFNREQQFNETTVLKQGGGKHETIQEKNQLTGDNYPEDLKFYRLTRVCRHFGNLSKSTAVTYDSRLVFFATFLFFTQAHCGCNFWKAEKTIFQLHIFALVKLKMFLIHFHQKY